MREQLYKLLFMSHLSSYTSYRFDTSAQVVVQKDQFQHTTSVLHTAVYKADLKDDGKEITCVATQVRTQEEELHRVINIWDTR